MLSLFPIIKYIFLHTAGIIIAFLALSALIILILRRLQIHKTILLTSFAVLGLALAFVAAHSFRLNASYPLFLETYGPGSGPSLPLSQVYQFFSHFEQMEKVADIARDPNDIPLPLGRDHSETVKITLTTREVLSEMAPGIVFDYWTFDGKIPGPFLRVREGDTVELTLKNDPKSLNAHSIDLHAVTGPGGGATVTAVMPGESKTLTFKALNPGLFVYHCAHTNAAAHMTHGMYGLILVEPKEGLPKIDKEFYVMQGEFYSTGELGKKGLQIFDADKMLHDDPEYVVYNGRIKSTVGKMEAGVGDRIRLYVGNGGVNLISSFHIIGEIFNTVFPEGSVGGAMLHNVQSTAVPAGGAAIVDLDLEVPGKYILVDHALARMDRGAWGVLEVKGEENKEIFDGVTDTSSGSGH